MVGILDQFEFLKGEQKKPDKLFLLFCLCFWYIKKPSHITKITIFIALKIDIKIANSSKDIEMAQGNIKI